jgi:predicted amidohydrolase YtcJ
VATWFHGGRIYLGNGEYSASIFVNDEGLVCDERAFINSDIQETLTIEGKTLLPAFRDSHAHPLFAGREAQGLDISGLKTIEAIDDALRAYLEANPNSIWIDAAVYDRSIAGEQTRQALDAFVSEIPVVLHADDHHTLWVNTKALEAAGLLTNNLPALSAGRIDVDELGLPTGILREWPAMSLVLDLAPLNSLQEDIAALVWAQDELISAGIVECQDAWIDRGMAEVYLEASKQGLLKIDFRLAFRADVETFLDDFDYFVETRQLLNKSEHLIGQAIKFFVDGVFGSATAAVSERYLSTQAYGDLNWSKDSLIAAINLAHQNGFQVHLHAIGDAGVEFALTCIEGSSASPEGLKPVIAHAELTSISLIQKAKSLEVNICLQPFWAQNNGMLLSCRDHLGQNRLDSLYSVKDMIHSGLNVSFSSDWPVSTPRVLSGIAVATFRRGEVTMEPHNPTQAISHEEAIDAYTQAACQLFGSETLGTLELGQPFDAVIVDRDLKEQDLDGFQSTKVLATYKAGKELLV